MTRVLVVHEEPSAAERLAIELGGLGVESLTCQGPHWERCPLLEGRPCAWVDEADVLIYDAVVLGEGAAGRRLVDELRDLYPDLPVVITASQGSLEWVEREGPHRVFPYVRDVDTGSLADVVRTALTEQGMAV